MLRPVGSRAQTLQWAVRGPRAAAGGRPPLPATGERPEQQLRPNTEKINNSFKKERKDALDVGLEIVEARRKEIVKATQSKLISLDLPPMK